ncbi:hypothetical protein MMAR_3940 [Mycobacterium marinum M]|uniref:Uncharacterized protein n=1 Tax=Mycobacterium marinum (strain ATCC BAA-535 / M) TaxID=216594 RepID=B2HPJ6_MYCMM|nr:hypothetical protein MMAR_3940 [Mycobacterium marinum M]
MTEQTFSLAEARVREIVREERAAENTAQARRHAAWRAEQCAQAKATIERLQAELEELGHASGEAIQVDARAPGQDLESALKRDHPVSQSGAKTQHRFFEMLQACVTLAAFGDSSGQIAQRGDSEAAGAHEFGDLVQHGTEHVPGVVGGGVHDASPSLDGDAPSVGDGPAHGGDRSRRAGPPASLDGKAVRTT